MMDVKGGVTKFKEDNNRFGYKAYQLGKKEPVELDLGLNEIFYDEERV